MEPQFWEPAIFLSGDAPNQPCPQVIDLTGRTRDLIFGPYRPLAAGVWRAVVRLSLCEDGARCRLTAEFGVYPDFTRVTVPFRQRGRHDIEITHALASDGLAEVRVMLTRAAFHGELWFGGVTIERLGDAPATPV